MLGRDVEFLGHLLDGGDEVVRGLGGELLHLPEIGSTLPCISSAGTIAVDESAPQFSEVALNSAGLGLYKTASPSLNCRPVKAAGINILFVFI